jgi:EAL domain-containing protein (putative c-di-GMP-specific phosphodiesterase class I)
MNDRLAHRHVLAHDLRRALTAGELELHYQPTVNLRTLRMSGVEALLRWRHPERGIISPTTFIPIAEDAGLITEIGRWALMTACRDAARWPAHLKVAVNLSAAQFREGDIVDDVRAALSRAGLRPERLILEITESLLLGESAATFETLNRLKALRVEIAMDDFGTGYSSLSYLRNYSFDSIKIDREFVGGAKNAPIIQAIVQLAQALGMTTVAEGIESAEDLAMLRAAGCSEGQGFLFSEAVPAARILEMIETEGSWIDKVA